MVKQTTRPRKTFTSVLKMIVGELDVILDDESIHIIDVKLYDVLYDHDIFSDHK